ncbi:MAG: phytanoyl-CoA dioxygenase family protein [Acidimicrobiales bacterium]
MSSRLVSAELIESFRERGFVVVPDLLTAAELDRFGAAVTRAVMERKRADRRSLAEKSRYEQSFIQCQNLWEDHPGVRPLSFHTRVAQAAAELLGVARIRLWHDQALYKEPGGRETDAHQDQPYWPIEEPLTVTAWIPFEGSTLESGAMGYVPAPTDRGCGSSSTSSGANPTTCCPARSWRAPSRSSSRSRRARSRTTTG